MAAYRDKSLHSERRQFAMIRDWRRLLTICPLSASLNSNSNFRLDFTPAFSLITTTFQRPSKAGLSKAWPLGGHRTWIGRRGSGARSQTFFQPVTTYLHFLRSSRIRSIPESDNAAHEPVYKLGNSYLHCTFVPFLQYSRQDSLRRWDNSSCPFCIKNVACQF